MKGKIYILKCPISKEIRYVGLTRVSLEHRLHLHLKENVKGLTYKINWIKSLKERNLKPIIEEIDSSSNLEELCKKEIYWIQYYLQKGCKLTNTIITYSNKPYKDFKNHLPKKVIQYDLKGNKIAEFASGYEVACFLGDCNANSTIYSILNNSKKYTYKGFTFLYENEEFKDKKLVKKGEHVTTKEHKEFLSLKAKERNSNKTSEYYKEIRKKVKPIVIVDITTNIEYNGILDAMNKLGKSRNYFWKHLKNKVNSPKFKYKDIVQST